MSVIRLSARLETLVRLRSLQASLENRDRLTAFAREKRLRNIEETLRLLCSIVLESELETIYCDKL